MTTEDTNRVNMVKSSVQFADDNPTPTSGIPAWATELAAVKAKLVLIDSRPKHFLI